MLSNIMYNSNYIKLPDHLQSRLAQAQKLNVKPSEDGIYSKKFLTLIACHSDSMLKLRTIINNVEKLSFPDNKIVIINSTNTVFSETLKKILNDKFPEVIFLETINTARLDSGKWMYYLETNFNDISEDFVIFTNDSYVLEDSIYYYYHFTANANCMLYGYNDSIQEKKYHYQSYLFSIRNDSLILYMRHFCEVSSKIHEYKDVVKQIEFKLCEVFPQRDCFLKIANLPGNNGKNIFYTNDNLYKLLKRLGGFPMTKLRRIINPNLICDLMTQGSHRIRNTNLKNIMNG